MSYKVLNIIKGTIYNIFNVNEGLRASREDLACKGCFAASTKTDGSYGGWCSKSKNSCGCLLASKTSVANEKCPNGIWSNDSVNLDTLDRLNIENNYIPSDEYLEMRKQLETK